MEADEAERIFDEFAEAYRDWWGPIIAPAALQVLDDVEVPSGDPSPFDLLDLGTGTGVLAVAALARWPGVHVLGIDLSGHMLELAAEAARRRSPADAPRFRTVVAGADRMPLADRSVDVAASSFVIQLVPSRARALREVLRVLRPGGIFACLTWQEDDLRFAPDEAFSDALDELQIIPPPDDRDVHPYTSAAAAAAEFRRAGFREVNASDVWLEHRFTPESYLDLLEHWIEREVFASLDAESRGQLRAVALRMMGELRPDAFLWRRPLVRVVGRRPSR
ncbi:MAG: class I SAM-dependent methyltransferase [Chloroflexi bacterium]|nr:class I SAM-dependent methyltransferase [Chloroflexota bacterium]